jgi:hypothetical protein
MRDAMKSRRTLLVLAILISFGLLLPSCSEPQIDSFLIANGNCQVPCWNSITPGVTTRSEATSAITESVDIENFSSTDTDFYFKYKTQFVHLLFDSTTHIVERIDLELDETSLGQIVDIFGEPEYLSFTMDGAWFILVYYPKTGQYFQGPCQTTFFGNAWKVSPNTKIRRVFLLNPTVDEARRNRLLFGDASERMKDGFIDWDGYKNYPFQFQ